MSEMSTTSIKRPLEPTVSLEFDEDDVDASPTSDEPRKKGGKPGRRPLDSDAKNKRTAQNRAAQRAFRERKEKKMKELDDKVRTLEELNQQSLVETEFLRSQLMTLVNELKRYRPESQNDSQVLEYLAKTEGGKSSEISQNKQDPNSKEIQESVRRKMAFTFAFPWKNDSNDNGSSNRNKEGRGSFGSNDGSQQQQQQDSNNNLLLQFPSPGSSSKSSSLSTTSLKQKNSLSSPLDVNGHNKSNNNKRNSLQANGSFSNSSNGFTPGSTSTGWMDNVFYNDDAHPLPQFYQADSANGNIRLPEDNATMSGGYDSITFSNQFNFNDKFDEQVSEFCTKLGQVCGTKDCPIPEKRKSSYLSPAVANTPVVLSNTWESPSEDSQQQPLSLVDDSSNPPMTRPKNKYVDGDASIGLNSPQYKGSELPFIDTSLAFPEEQDLFRDSQPDNLFAEFIEDDPQKDTSNSGNESSANNDQNSLLALGLVQEEPSAITPKPIEEPSDAITTATANNNNNTNNNNNDNTNNNGNDNEKGTQESQEQNIQDGPNGDTVVPSSDGKLLKCSEVWDRITSHPKYSDIDIDGLCQELMAKAKCSEKGVVVQSEDVQRALNNRIE